MPCGAPQVLVFCLLSLAVFLVAVWQLDPVVRWLWPIPVAMFVIYPYLKRFTWLSHFWLGAVDGLAPVGGWVAVTGELPARGLAARVARSRRGSPASTSSTRSSTSRSTGARGCTRSPPALAFPRPSGSRARSTWRPSLLLVWAGAELSVDIWYWLGAGAVASLLAYEQLLVSPADQRRLNMAFFTMNGVISLVFFGFVLLDVLA